MVDNTTAPANKLSLEESRVKLTTIEKELNTLKQELINQCKNNKDLFALKERHDTISAPMKVPKHFSHNEKTQEILSRLSTLDVEINEHIAAYKTVFGDKKLSPVIVSQPKAAPLTTQQKIDAANTKADFDKLMRDIDHHSVPFGLKTELKRSCTTREKFHELTKRYESITEKLQKNNIQEYLAANDTQRKELILLLIRVNNYLSAYKVLFEHVPKKATATPATVAGAAKDSAADKEEREQQAFIAVEMELSIIRGYVEGSSSKDILHEYVIRYRNISELINDAFLTHFANNEKPRIAFVDKIITINNFVTSGKHLLGDKQQELDLAAAKAKAEEAERKVAEAKKRKEEEKAKAAEQEKAKQQQKENEAAAARDVRSNQLNPFIISINKLKEKQKSFLKEFCTSRDPIYRSAFDAVAKLIKSLEKNVDDYVNNKDNTMTLALFKERSTKDIEDKQYQVLEVHRGYKEFFSNLLLAIATLGIGYIAATFFTQSFTPIKLNTGTKDVLHKSQEVLLSIQ